MQWSEQPPRSQSLGPSRVYGSLREDSIIIFCHLATRWSRSYRPWIWKYSPYGNFKASPSRTALFSAGRSHVKRDNLLQQLRLTVTTSHTNPPMSTYFLKLRVSISEKYETVSNYSHIMSNQDLVIAEPTMTSCNMARWTPSCQGLITAVTKLQGREENVEPDGREVRRLHWYCWKKSG